MVLFGGPIFTGWYWDPIFFTIVFGPVLVGLAFAADRLVGRKLAAVRRGALAVGVVAGGTLLILGTINLLRDVRFDREARAVASGIDFTTYEPKPLPQAFTEVSVDADDAYGGPAVVSLYATGPGAYATAVQQPPGAVLSLQPHHCHVEARAMPGTSVMWDRPCRLLRSQHGVSVYITDPGTSGIHAFAMLDQTLVRLQFTQVADGDVVAYFDSLQPIAVEDLEFNRG
jgi:hypothetical protein